MLATNTNFKIRLHAAPPLCSQLHKLANTLAIKHLKRIFGHDLALDVIGQEATRVIATQTKRCLCQVVGTKGKEIGVSGNVVGFDPKLGPLANNGGLTQTFALLSGSHAVEAGTNTGC